MLVPAASADEEGLEGAEEDAVNGEVHLVVYVTDICSRLMVRETIYT